MFTSQGEKSTPTQRSAEPDNSSQTSFLRSGVRDISIADRPEASSAWCDRVDLEESNQRTDDEVLRAVWEISAVMRTVSETNRSRVLESVGVMFGLTKAGHYGSPLAMPQWSQATSGVPSVSDSATGQPIMPSKVSAPGRGTSRSARRRRAKRGVSAKGTPAQPQPLMEVMPSTSGSQVKKTKSSKPNLAKKVKASGDKSKTTPSKYSRQVLDLEADLAKVKMEIATEAPKVPGRKLDDLHPLILKRNGILAKISSLKDKEQPGRPKKDTGSPKGGNGSGMEDTDMD